MWNDLGWDDVTPAVAEGDYLQITGATQTDHRDAGARERTTSRRRSSRTKTRTSRGARTMSSADLAYVLYQVPMLVAVHASEMLPED